MNEQAIPTGRDGFAVPTGAERVQTQEAPYPDLLEQLVGRLRYREREGWRYWLQNMDRGQGSKGLTLVIQRCGPDSYHPENVIRVNHLFPVPPAAYDVRSWRRWLFDQVHDVELHELMENFRELDDDGNETRPYAPSHGPGNNPYLIREVGTDEDRRTSFRGELNP